MYYSESTINPSKSLTLEFLKPIHPYQIQNRNGKFKRGVTPQT